MSSITMFCGCLVLLTAFIASTEACGKGHTDDDKPKVVPPKSVASRYTDNACCMCDRPINITFVARNYHQEPYFETTRRITGYPQRELLYFLQEAAKQEPTFSFDSRFYSSWGYMITTINNTVGSNDERTFWHIASYNSTENSFESLQLGVSSYKPSHEETIVFNFTTWDVLGYH